MERDGISVRTSLHLDIASGFRNVAELLADTTLSYSPRSRLAHSVTPGALVHVFEGGFSYRICSASSTDAHLWTAGGVGLEAVQHALSGFVPEQFGAVGDGETDDQFALELFIAACRQARCPVRLPGRAYAHSNVLTDTSGLDWYGSGERTRLVALPGFPLTYQTDEGGSSIPAPQVWIDRRNELSDRGRLEFQGITIDGNKIAPCGVLITAGATLHLHDCGIEDHTQVNLVLDAVQNSKASDLRLRRCDGFNLRLVNFVRRTRVERVDCRKSGPIGIDVDVDSSYPGYDGVTSNQNEPAHITFCDAVWEDIQPGQTKASVLHLGDCGLVKVEDVQIVDSAGGRTGPLVDISATANYPVFESCRFNGGLSPLPLLEQGGFEARFVYCEFLNAGKVSGPAQDVIQCSGRTFFEDPIFTNIEKTGKLISSGGSPLLATLRSKGFASGTTGNRPSMEDVDAVFRYYNTSFGREEIWDHVAGRYVLSDGTPADVANQTLQIGAGASAVITPVAARETWMVSAYRTGSTSQHAVAVIKVSDNDSLVTPISSNEASFALTSEGITLSNDSGSTRYFVVSARRL